ncbi:MAG: glycosyltransferase family 2 protein [Bacillota bacterium]|nr:glycosyltransferase family 2 protein [Bacillota bacterium]
MFRRLKKIMPSAVKNLLRTVITDLGYTAYVLNKKKYVRISGIDPNRARDFCDAYSPKPATMVLPRIKKEAASLDLTVIVPVYKAEKYIESCIASILNQKTKYSFEVITVNDASPDNSGNILSSLNDKRLRLISLEKNLGGAHARNIGITEANGRYIMFVDSDDRLLPGAIEKLMDAAVSRGADIVQGQFANFFDGGKRMFVSDRYKPCEITDDLRALLRYPGFTCMKVYKRELWDNAGLLEGNVFDDTVIWFLVFPKCRRFVCISDLVYAYRFNESGLTWSNRSRPKALDAYWAIETLSQQRESLGLPLSRDLYLITLIQLSKFLWQRNQNAEENVLENVFVLSCELLEKMRAELNMNTYSSGNKLIDAVEVALQKRDFGSWRRLSRLMQ